MTIKTAADARDLLIIRGQDVQLTNGRHGWCVNGEQVTSTELIQIARQLDGGEAPSKYGNTPVEHDGRRFASIAECMRYQELRQLELAGEISDLELQPRFEILPGFVDWSGKRHQPVFYVGDFGYKERGRIVCEDVKGAVTDVYAIKRKMFLHAYPHIELREIKA